MRCEAPRIVADGLDGKRAIPRNLVAIRRPHCRSRLSRTDCWPQTGSKCGVWRHPEQPTWGFRVRFGTGAMDSRVASCAVDGIVATSAEALGTNFYKTGRVNLRLRLDVENLNTRPKVINSGRLFPAIRPALRAAISCNLRRASSAPVRVWPRRHRTRLVAVGNL